MGKTYIASNIKRESIVIDAKGNEMSRAEFERRLKKGDYSQHDENGLKSNEEKNQ